MAVLLRLLSNHEVEIVMLLPRMILPFKTIQKQQPVLPLHQLDVGMERVLWVLEAARRFLVAHSYVRFVVRQETVELIHTNMLWIYLLA